MTRRHLRLLLCLCLLSCGGVPRTVIVTLAGRPAEAVSVRATVSLDGKAASEAPEFTRDLDQFALRLPDDAAGLLQVNVEALDTSRCLVAKGHGELTLGEDRTVAIALTLTRIMPPVCAAPK